MAKGRARPSPERAAPPETERRTSAPREAAYSYVALLGVRAKDLPALLERIEAGFPYRTFLRLQRATDLSTAELADVVRISTRTLVRRKAEGKLQPDESDGVLRASKLFTQAVDLFEGDEDAARAWLRAPKKALAGKSPLEFARTETGAREVERLVHRLEHGVYS